jgi:transposase
MDAAPQTSPDDVAALKAALALSEERRQRTDAELAVAKAMASEDKALIAHQALRIAVSLRRRPPCEAGVRW